MKYYIICGERSGDLHASNLAAELLKKDPQAVIRGMGGEQLQGQGAEIALHYKEVAFMGFWEVFKNLNSLSKSIKFIQADILAFAPDVLILIDFAGFNLRIADFARKKDLLVLYYISPKIWAWKQSRAYKIKRLVHKMFVIMPFEKAFYAKFGYKEVEYVGNPIIDAIAAFKRENPGIARNEQVIAILPGSRKQEVEVMMKKIPAIAAQFSEYTFTVAGVSNLNPAIYDAVTALPNVSLHFDASYEILSKAGTAIVTSGTATLETALFNVPQVVVYATSALTYSIAKRLIKVPFISLVNLIGEKAIVKELIQRDFNPESLIKEVYKILPGRSDRAAILEDYQILNKKLGTEGASYRTAEGIIEELRKRDK